MGGKAKQAQRVKGNLKPASSNAAFYSLHQSDSSLFAVDSGLTFGSTLVEDVDIDFSSADPSFQLVLKKCLKKDPTTKIKALKELIDLINLSQLEIVRTALPFFPKIYNQLSTDSDARVRETCQSSLSTIVAKVGKNLATILKQIFGSWICNMYDTNPMAASIATNCFEKAFPPHKVADVFLYCEQELLEFFNKNLNQHTIQTVCNPKMYTEEEREAKYQRMLISSFRGYSLYLQKISTKSVEENKYEEKNRQIVENDRFWSHHKSKSSKVRSAFFEGVSNVLDQSSFLLKNVEQKLTSIVFKSINESEPEVLTHVWTCVVLIQQKIENWMDFVNFEKAFLPKLSKILRTANCPNLIYPNLLPLMSKIDQAITEKGELDKFYIKFFDDIKHGMINVPLGKSELVSVTSAYVETLQYVIMKISSSTVEEDRENRETFIFNLLDDHIIAVIYWCINTETNYGRAIFPQIRNFIQYFSKNSKTHEKFLERFWSELYLVLNSSIMTPSTNEKNIALNHIELIKQLRAVKKPSAKIRFQDQTDGSAHSDGQNLNDSTSENNFADHLLNFASKLCITYIEKINTMKECVFIENLEILVKENQTLEFLQKLAGWENPKETKLSSLCNTFIGWLEIENLSCELIVELILVLYRNLEPSDKIDLQKIMKISSARMWLIERTLSHPFCNDPTIVKFLKSDSVVEYLIECAEFVIRNATNADYLSILQKSFFHNDENVMLIDSETCKKIVDIMRKPLEDIKLFNQLDQCSSFLAQIFSVLSSDAEFDGVKMVIFFSLFELSVMRDISEEFSEDTMWEVTTSWEDALSANEIQVTDELLEKCATIVQKKINSILLQNYSIQSLQKFAKVINKLVNCITDQNEKDNKMKVIEKVLRKVLVFDEESSNYIENLASYILSIKGKLTTKSIHDVPENNFYKMMNSYLRSVLINLETLVGLCCGVSNKDNEDNESEECEDSENSVSEWNEFFVDFFLQISYADAMLDILMNHLSKLIHEDWVLYLQERLKCALKNFPENIFDTIREKLFESAAKRGEVRVECLRRLLDTKLYNNDIGLLFKDANDRIQRQNSELADVNILQSFASSIEKKTMSISTINSSDVLVKISFARSLLKNYLEVDNFNQYADRKVVGYSLLLLNEIIQKQISERFLLYNKDISLDSEAAILLSAEAAHFFADILTFIPYELDSKSWDFIRLALSSWILSVSKSLHKLSENKVRVFIAGVFRFNASLSRFIREERTKSSTPLLKDVIEEWDKVFAKDVNVIMVKSFVNIIKQIDYESKHQEIFSDVTCSFVDSIDLKYCLIAKKIDKEFSLDDLIKFALDNYSSKSKRTCVAVSTILKNLAGGLIKIDQEVLLQRNSEDDIGKNDEENKENNQWHILDAVRSTLETYQVVMSDYIEDFSFKLTELDNLADVPENIAFSYLLLWNSILNFCSSAPAELRSIYARWITVHDFQDVFLVSLFKLMPREMIRNPEVTGYFNLAAFNVKEIDDATVSIEKFAAYLYAECLRTIPVIVRRWWHSSTSRQAQIVEKITQNNFSPVLSQQDLTILTKREKDGKDNMHIKVLMQSREIFASYSLEDAKMELSIALPPNYPLGAIKIESLKHIAGRFEAREIVKQLSIYLTHQNGRLYDGILLWKRNLDRKYEGVEECYVCYSVINQDTFQLPRLTCKTCKKKFHSNCLYKWFTSSNKSTCPLCRNIF